jgi:hypothetical protein
MHIVYVFEHIYKKKKNNLMNSEQSLQIKISRCVSRICNAPVENYYAQMCGLRCN